MSVELDGQLTSLSNSENEAYKWFVEFTSLLDIFLFWDWKIITEVV